MKTTLLYVSLALLLVTGCRDTNSNKSKVLNYEFKQIEYKTPNCEPEHDPCFLASLTYPEFNSGDSLAIFLANRIVKNSTLDFIGMGGAETTSEPDLPDAVADLNKSFEDYRSEFPGSGIGWEARIIMRELYRNDSILAFETAAITYFGGAHPNKNIRYFNFNRYSGGLITLSNLVTDLEDFTKRSETVFRNKYGIKDKTFSEAGFQFLGNKFTLPANYVLIQDSIKLHYNQYEIAPYSAGDFEITVSIR